MNFLSKVPKKNPENCRMFGHLATVYWRRGAKTGVVGSKSRIYPRFQNLSFCDVTRVGMISNYPCCCVFKNATFCRHGEKQG